MKSQPPRAPSAPRIQAERDVPVRDVALITTRFFSSAFLWRCPVCARGPVIKSFFEIFDRCSVCGAQFKRGDSGNWLVAATLNYFLNALLMVVVAGLLIWRFGFFDGLVYVVIGIVVATALVIYRPMQAIGVWLLWVFGFIYPDE